MSILSVWWKRWCFYASCCRKSPSPSFLRCSGVSSKVKPNDTANSCCTWSARRISSSMPQANAVSSWSASPYPHSMWFSNSSAIDFRRSRMSSVRTYSISTALCSATIEQDVWSTRRNLSVCVYRDRVLVTRCLRNSPPKRVKPSIWRAMT